MAAAGLSDIIKFHSSTDMVVKRPHGGILKPIDKNELSVNKRVKYKVTDPIVAPVEKTDVPDHLLNTKIYAKLQRNQTFEVVPVEVHFAGFEVDPNGAKRYEQTLRVINISSEVQRMVVLPPKTPYFTVHYTKPDRLVPGFSLDIKVIFKPDEYRYFKDAIRIYSEGDENLFVPIHAYPIVSTHDLPTKYSFPSLPIGKSLAKVFNMRSTAPVEFEYMIEIVQKHPAFDIEPLEGIIPYNKDAIVKVTFAPREFCTATMTVQILVSQFNSKPIVCKFYGTSTPGLASEIVQKELNKELESYKRGLRLKSQLAQEESGHEQPPRGGQPRQIESSGGVYGQDVAPKPESFVDIDGYRFPKNLNNPWAISKVLLQKKGKLSLKDIRESKKSIKLSAQIKENLFLQKVKEFEDEERRNQLKWQVKLGEDPIDEAIKEEILKSRAKAEYDYKVSIGVPIVEQELNRQVTLATECRTIRPYTQLARSDITFDEFKNQIWDLRYMALDRFIQSARKIIVKQRLGKVLAALKKFIKSWMEAQQNSEEGPVTIELFIEVYYKKLKGQKLDDNEEIRAMSAKNIGTYYFPQVAEQRELTNQKARHCEKLQSISKLDSLGQVAVKPIEFQIKTATPFANLNVPVLYKLNEYRPLVENNYVPKHENRVLKLRCGAEDELTKFDSAQYAARLLPAIDAADKTTVKQEQPVVGEKTMKSKSTVAVAAEPAVETSRAQMAQQAEGPQIIEFKPLKDLHQPFDYPPMHIFNPAPGIMSYQKLLPYSGVDLNYHLNPLPQFIQDQQFSTQKRFLDREEIIKGVMQWKKFPSQGLISLSNTPTLTDVWVPRWSNVFGTDIMPVDTPPLLAGLPEEDKKILSDNSDPSEDQLPTSRSVSSRATKEPRAQITPESVNAQFNIPEIFESRQKMAKEEIKFPYGDKLPSTNMPVSAFGQVPRDQREQELEYFLSKQYNAVGLKLNKKLYALDQQVTAAAAAAASNVSTSSVIYDPTVLNEADESMNEQPTLDP